MNSNSRRRTNSASSGLSDELAEDDESVDALEELEALMDILDVSAATLVENERPREPR